MIRLQLFGRAVLKGPEPVSGPAAQRQRLALLALLAVAREAGMSRDKLIALLWPEADTERGRHLLSNSIYVLRRGLGGDVVLAEGDALRLNPACIGSDVGDFMDALDRGDDAAAASHSTAPFLDGFFLPGADEFERWVEVERNRIARARAGALERLAERAEAAGDFRVAAEWWQRLAAADPYSSRAALRLMQALAGAGEPAAAIQHARQHEKRLREDLEAELSGEITALVSRLSSSGRSRAPGPAAQSVQPAAAVGTAPAARESPSSDQPMAAGEPAAAAAASRRRRLRAPVLVGLVLPLLLAGVALLRAYSNGAAPTSAAADPLRTIAVLPFVNLTPDSSDQYFSDGLTEELINRLTQIEGLRVAARTSSFTFKGASADVAEIGRRLNVELLLEGSVRRDGERLRIAAQLVKVADGYHIWSRTWDERALTDLFDIQDEIAREIAASVLPRLAAGDQPGGAGTTDLHAWDAYQRGRYAFWRVARIEDVQAAIAHYEEAIRHDPQYAPPYAGLADAYMLLPGPPAEHMRKAKQAAQRALELDDELSEGYVALASINWFYDWDWEAAERNYRRSFSVNRVVYTRCICYALYLAAIGDWDGAVREAQRARTFDPVALLPLTTLADVYLASGRTRDLRALLPTLEREGAARPLIRWLTAWLEWDEGRPEVALAQMEDLRAGRPADSLAVKGPWHLMPALAYMYASTGRTADALALADALARMRTDAYVPSTLLASLFAAAGDTVAAARWIRAAVEERANLAYFALTPAARSLRQLGTFQDALHTVGVPRRTGIAAR